MVKCCQKEGPTITYKLVLNAFRYLPNVLQKGQTLLFTVDVCSGGDCVFAMFLSGITYCAFIFRHYLYNYYK